MAFVWIPLRYQGFLSGLAAAQAGLSLLSYGETHAVGNCKAIVAVQPTPSVQDCMQSH